MIYITFLDCHKFKSLQITCCIIRGQNPLFAMLVLSNVKAFFYTTTHQNDKKFCLHVLERSQNLQTA
jgi:hypothetical protein